MADESLVSSEVLDQVAFETTHSFLTEHRFPALALRLLANMRAEVECVQVMREFWFKYLDASPEKLVKIYEGVYDRRKTAHYENLIVMFLVSLVAGLLAEILGGIVVEEYVRNKDKIVGILRKTVRGSSERLRSAKRSDQTEVWQDNSISL